MAAGQFEFVHNVRVSGMLHGQVVRPPAVGAMLVSVEDTSVRGVPGIVKVVVKNNFVGVVAEKPWQALQAANKLKVTWTPGTRLPLPARLPRIPAESEADARHISRQLEGCGGKAGQRSESCESYVPLPLPNAWIGGQLVCSWRCKGR